MYLIYSYQHNEELLSEGLHRGHQQELIGYYRRECLLVRQHDADADADTDADAVIVQEAPTCAAHT